MLDIPGVVNNEVKDTPPSTNELDDILKGYQTADVTPPPAVNNPLGLPDGYSNPQPAKALPFLTHDPSLAPGPQYYQRGPKKGQLKPPGKGKAPALNQAGQLSIQATSFISGAIFITMIDLLLPLVITGLYNFVQGRKNPDFPMDYEKMKMTPSQRGDLGTVADAVVRELKLSGSPTFLFFLGLTGIYFMNFLLQKTLVEKSEAKNKANEKVNSSPNPVVNRQSHNPGNPN